MHKSEFDRVRNTFRKTMVEVIGQAPIPKDELLEEIIAAVATAIVLFQVGTEQEAVHKLELYMQHSRLMLEEIGAGTLAGGSSPEA